MSNAVKPIVVVAGATGAQGGGVATALLSGGGWQVRAMTRNADSAAARQLAERGCELVEADFNEPDSLDRAFRGAYGAFLVTNFWDSGTGLCESAQGRAAVTAARDAGVQHLVWSTLPDYTAISGSRFQVDHYSQKALVDESVKTAGFRYHTFVQAPFYFQNLLGVQAPRQQPDGSRLWRLPIAENARCIDLGDVAELGKLVNAVLRTPEKTGAGQYLALSSDRLSWADLKDILNSLGHRVRIERVSDESYDKLFRIAPEFRQMMQFWEVYGYYGPDGDKAVALANSLVPEGYTPFRDWAALHMKP